MTVQEQQTVNRALIDFRQDDHVEIDDLDLALAVRRRAEDLMRSEGSMDRVTLRSTPRGGHRIERRSR
jgi:hypothetical protein